MSAPARFRCFHGLRRALSRGLAAALVLFCAASHAVAEEVRVLRDGKAWGNVETYRVAEDSYLEAKEAGRLYGARVDYYGVSGKVSLSLNGRKAVLAPDSAQAQVGGKSVELSMPVLLRGGKAMIPMDFFLGEAFSEVAGYRARFDPRARLLELSRRASVGPLRWATYPDHTRVVLELGEGLAYKSERKGLRSLEISIPRGGVEWDQKAEVGDGVVETVVLEQQSRQAALRVWLRQDSARWTLKEFSSPRRIVIDVARGDAPFSSPVPVREGEGRSGEQVPRVPAGDPEAAAPAEAVPLAVPAVVANASSAAAVATPVAAVAAGSAAPATAVKGPRKRLRVTLDPGHGGKDSGAPGLRGLLEKDVNLSVAHELARLLEEQGGFEVFLTRQTDVFLPLNDRSRLSNEWGADLFVSLHCNAHPSRAENGLEIYFLSERASDPEAERLAEFENSVLALEGRAEVEDDAAEVLYQLARTEFINDASELSGVLFKTLSRSLDFVPRGIRQASFYVLRGANAPAVLVEMGFVTNPQDEARLESKKYRRRIAEGLAAGLREFVRRKEWGEGR